MNRRTPLDLFVVASSLLVAGFAAERAAAQEAAEYQAAMAQWHREREAQLKGPEGWLNLAESDGTVILDFNRAYNPPCVFNEFASCPLPTRRNYLQVAVEAGEMYKEGFHALGL